MFGSQAVELFVAIVTMLFVVSLASSTIVEGIGNMGRRRGKELEKAVAKLLGVEAKPVVDRVKDENVPGGLLTKTLSVNTRLSRTPTVNEIQVKPGRFPSAISDQTFLDIADDVANLKDLSEAEAPEFEAWVEAVAAADPTGLALEPKSAAEERVQQLTSGSPDAAEGAKEELLRKFHEAMDRLSSAYQRRTKAWLFLVGLLIAVCGNVSVYHIAQTLWSDDTAREAVVEAAANIGEEEGLEPEELNSIGAAVEELQDASLPVGWTDEAKDAWGGRGWDEFDLGRLGLLFSWVATAALVTLGAPFWFDLLTKAVPRALGDRKKDSTTTANQAGSQ